jgi:CheY-like chemotaxis protein
MTRQFHILVADRNRHVRELLRRELMAEGYTVQLARDSREVMTCVEGTRIPDLLILDPDIPNLEGISMLESLSARRPPIPMVVHSLAAESGNLAPMPAAAALVEKSGDTDHLKRVIFQVLQKYYPNRSG